MSIHSVAATLYLGVTLTALLTPTLKGQTQATCNGLPATIIASAPGTIVGTPGDDVIIGTAGDDKINGLGGNDTICALGGHDQISGGQGADTLFGGEGNDTFLWSPGDGSDRIEGSTGADTLLFTGANVSEKIGFSANGSRLRVERDIASIVLDIAGVERVDCDVRGGADSITVSSLTGTEVQQVNIDLEGIDNSNAPDAQADSLFLFGSAGADNIAISGSGNNLTIAGAGPVIRIRNPDPALDSLAIYGEGGNDIINAQNLAAGVIRLTVEGGAGSDTITGSRGPDSLVGGEGDDTFVWPVGSPADLIGGEAGSDTLQVLGTVGADNVTVWAGAVESQVLNITDGVTFLTDVEQIILRVGTGADQITVNAAAAVKLAKVTVDLRVSTTGSTVDGSPDTIVVNGTTGPDNVAVNGAPGTAVISGLAPVVEILGSEYPRDTLVVNSGAESDVVTAAGLGTGVIRLSLRGGQGNDKLTGSSGDDEFAWFPGDGSDVIHGGAGNDALKIAGANISEAITISANGTHLRFTRDVASIVLDAAAVESLSFAALGGSDTVSLSDIASTGIRQVAVDLAGSAGSAGDGQPDTVSITAISSDAITTILGAGSMAMVWHGVKYSITGVEAASDRFILQTAQPAVPSMISAVQTEATARAEGGTRQ